MVSDIVFRSAQSTNPGIVVEPNAWCCRNSQDRNTIRTDIYKHIHGLASLD
jgi:hypothetical protein